MWILSTSAADIVDRLLEAVYWKRYAALTKAQQAALYHWMVLEGGVMDDEYREHMRKRLFGVQLIQPASIVQALKHWHTIAEVPYPFDLHTSQYKNDQQRISKIARLHRKGGLIWPYIADGCTSFREWAKSPDNHGDGWHRMLLAVRQNRPIEFIFIRPVDGPVRESDDEPEAFVRDFVNRDLAVNFLIHKSGESNVWATDPFRSDYIVYSEDKHVSAEPASANTRTFEGYLRKGDHDWQAYPKGSDRTRPIGTYPTDQQAAFAVYKFNRTHRVLEADEDSPEVNLPGYSDQLAREAEACERADRYCIYEHAENFLDWLGEGYINSVWYLESSARYVVVGEDLDDAEAERRRQLEVVTGSLNGYRTAAALQKREIQFASREPTGGEGLAAVRYHGGEGACAPAPALSAVIVKVCHHTPAITSPASSASSASSCAPSGWRSSRSAGTAGITSPTRRSSIT